MLRALICLRAKCTYTIRPYHKTYANLDHKATEATEATACNQETAAATPANVSDIVMGISLGISNGAYGDDHWIYVNIIWLFIKQFVLFAGIFSK